MRTTIRYDKDKLPYYSFDFDHPVTGQRTRLKKADAPLFRTKPEADAWARTQAAEHHALRDAAKQRLEWQTKYHDFKDHSDKFIEWKKAKAPRAYLRSVVLIERYVFYYFLSVQKCNIINSWHLHFQSFIDWLGKTATQVYNDKPLSISSQNHAINALNSFLGYMAAYNQISPESAKKCPLHPSEKLGTRTHEDVYTPEELEEIEGELRKLDEATADFFHVLSKTGMRFNELYSLPFSALFKGEMKKEMHDELTLHKISHVGHILLESQIVKDEATDSLNHERLPDGSHTRGPLKGRKVISAKNSRHIPVESVETWNILVKRYKAQSDKFDKAVWGTKKESYLLFEDVEHNKARRLLKQVLNKLNIRIRDYHCLRHTLSTNMVGRTRSWFLARAILGHKSEREFERYCHVFAQLTIEAKRNTQKIDFL